MSLRMRRWKTGVMAATVAALAGSVLVYQPAAADEAAPLDSVSVTASNADNITGTAAGTAELQEFADHMKDATEGSPSNAAATAAPKGIVPAAFRTPTGEHIAVPTIGRLTSSYRVLKVDMEKVQASIAPGASCANAEGDTDIEDVLVVPPGATNIRYETTDSLESGTPGSDGQPDRCDVSVVWDEADTGNTNDDLAAPAANRPYDFKYAGDCFGRKNNNVTLSGRAVRISWNDGCYADDVVRYDGNSAWNYYTVKSISTCANDHASVLTSCGHGIKQDKAKEAGNPQWQDWAPRSDSTGDCRTKSISVSAGPISIGGDYRHCDTQKIYKYTEAGKMSSYWEGKRDGTRGTEHQISVKMPQVAGRPHWTHWLNSDACIACYKP
ncbi:hypothetical protein AB0D27_12090 [Streptomyces sp. NPDC048415]|uniref:hypothetical protein n=1 Tax=Streptomyces sp. NPDC048415 TaxID=3154822 RepID=UPI0034494899